MIEPEGLARALVAANRRKRVTKGAFAALLLAALTFLAPGTPVRSSAAASTQMRFEFEGKFILDSYPHNPLSSPLSAAAIGVPYKFSMTIDPASPDLTPGDPNVGIYDAVTSNELQIGTGALSDFVLRIAVFKDLNIGGQLFVRFLVQGYRNPGGAYAGPGSFFFAVQLSYEAGTFATDELPLTLPDPSTAKGETGVIIREQSGLNGYGMGLALYVGDIKKIAVDSDSDGVFDATDNCKWVANPDQADTNGDGVGDACSGSDLDGDGVPDSIDNCKWIANPAQKDTDGNGIGDVYQVSDPDGDGVPDSFDNCKHVFNPGQEDSDKDGVGDACDVCPLDANNDVDGDGVCPATDSCPAVYNPDQLDTDADGLGDACDDDDDNDGVLDVYELAKGSDPRNPDTDGDGVSDAVDKCPGVLVDQAFDVAVHNLTGIVNKRVTLAQSFTVGSSGILYRVQVPIARNESYDVDTEVRDVAVSIVKMSGDGPDDSQVLGSVIIPASTVPKTPGVFFPYIAITAGPFNIPVSAGDELALVVSSPGTVDTPLGPYFWDGYADDGAGGGGGGYVHGQFYSRLWTGAWTEGPTRDLGFRVFVKDPSSAGGPVNANGCTIAQICPCTAAWKAKGSYLSCIATTATAFLGNALISETEKDQIVSTAAKSGCGKK